MSNKLFLLLPLLAGVPLFLTGALSRPSADTAASPFLAQPIQWTAPDGGPAGLFDLALQRLSPEQISWLQVTLWQRMSTPESAFESQGALQIGPRNCARLDLTVRTGANPGRWLVVSDGHALAQVVQLGTGTPTVTTRLLEPQTQEADPPGPTPANEALRALGCGGPYPLLKELRGRLRDLTLQTGLFQGRPVARLHGRLKIAPSAPATGTAVGADFCYVYLDPQTLWPIRLEWWGANPERVQRLLLEIEFRDPQVNRPLSLTECMRVFSYCPEQG
jgi:hypothetical protein